ncbi:MAG: transporter substrate-binding domain-containing protein, partial [Chloroflexota bacterium]
RGTTSIENLRTEADKLGIQVAVVEVDDHTTGLQELVAGTVDAYTTDASILAGLSKQQPGLTVVGGPFSFEPYGFGLPTGDSRFKDLVDFTLQDLYLDGTYATLYQVWLLGGSPEGINVGGEVFQMAIWPTGNLANYILDK